MLVVIEILLPAFLSVLLEQSEFAIYTPSDRVFLLYRVIGVVADPF